MDFKSRAEAILYHAVANAAIDQLTQAHLEAVKEARIDEVNRVHDGANKAAWERTPNEGSRELNFYDFDHYLIMRRAELRAGLTNEPQE